MQMTIDAIHPFIRYVRYLNPNDEVVGQHLIPYDNRLFYCAEGKGSFLANDKIYHMNKGDLILIKSGISYRTITHPHTKLKYLAVNFDYLYQACRQSVPIPPMILKEDSPAFDKSLLLEELTFTDYPELNDVVYLNNQHSLSQQILEMEHIYRQQLSHSAMQLSGIFLLLLSKIAAELQLRKADIRTPSHKMEQIIDFIHLHYATPFTNQSLGDYFHFHPNYLNHLMVSYTGQSLHQYVLRTRIAESIRLLETSTLTVSEISERVGFSDVSHFSHYFKKMIGKSPRNYQQH